jgi:hypothetical protein
VKIGAWLAKTRTKHRDGQLLDDQVRLIAAPFDGDGTAEDTSRPIRRRPVRRSGRLPCPLDTPLKD